MSSSEIATENSADAIILDLLTPSISPAPEPVPTESVVVNIPVVETAPAPAPAPLDPRAKDLAALVISSINWTQPAAQVLRIAVEIEKLKDLTPGQKIKLAQDTFTYISRETGLTPTEKETAEFFIEHVLPHIYNAVLHVTSNQIVGAVKMSGCC